VAGKQRVFGGQAEGIWRASRGFLEGKQRVFGGQAEDIWHLLHEHEAAIIEDSLIRLAQAGIQRLVRGIGSRIPS
jgi:hypothetical protein